MYLLVKESIGDIINRYILDTCYTEINLLKNSIMFRVRTRSPWICIVIDYGSMERASEVFHDIKEASQYPLQTYVVPLGDDDIHDFSKNPLDSDNTLRETLNCIDLRSKTISRNYSNKSMNRFRNIKNAKSENVDELKIRAFSIVQDRIHDLAISNPDLRNQLNVLEEDLIKIHLG